MRAVKVVLVLLAVLLVASCASQPVPPASDAPGLLMGFLHGCIAPFSLIGSFFSPSVRMYAYPNAGVVYDLGFFLGIAALTSGSVFSVSIKRS